MKLSRIESMIETLNEALLNHYEAAYNHKETESDTASSVYSIAEELAHTYNLGKVWVETPRGYRAWFSLESCQFE